MKWVHMPKYQNKKAIICDGSVRSGKTVSMIIGFVHWAMRYFDGCNFGICGKTVGSTYRNVVTPMLGMPDVTDYYELTYRRGDNLLTIKDGDKINRFYVFGGRDESSYTLIQGITLSGAIFDEVALMPRSFVEQALARMLSEPKARYWFNCNPDSPEHWFYKEWICNTSSKRALHLHFTMYDNPTLTDTEREEAQRLYSGVFYDRYVLGLWVMAEGLIYHMFRRSKHVIHADIKHPEYYDWYMSCDYGTRNPTSIGLWAVDESGKAIRVREYYYDGKAQGVSRTDEEHYAALVKLAGAVADRVRYVIVDPSAASFMECIRRHGGFRVRTADNAVVDGIRDTATLLKNGYLYFDQSCKDTIREFGLYRWDEKSPIDKPVKENDHAMDDVRYFVRTAMLKTLRALRREGEISV